MTNWIGSIITVINFIWLSKWKKNEYLLKVRLLNEYNNQYIFPFFLLDWLVQTIFIEILNLQIQQKQDLLLRSSKQKIINSIMIIIENVYLQKLQDFKCYSCSGMLNDNFLITLIIFIKARALIINDSTKSGFRYIIYPPYNY